MKTNKKSKYRRITLLCVALCLAAILSACGAKQNTEISDAQSVLSPGVQILSACTEMAVWGPRGNDVTFEAEDFSRNLNLSKIDYIKVVKRGDDIVIFRVARNDPHVIKARGHLPTFFFCAELVQPYAVVFEIARSGNAPFASCKLGCKGGEG